MNETCTFWKYPSIPLILILISMPRYRLGRWAVYGQYALTVFTHLSQGSRSQCPRYQLGGWAVYTLAVSALHSIKHRRPSSIYPPSTNPRFPITNSMHSSVHSGSIRSPFSKSGQCILAVITPFAQIVSDLYAHDFQLFLRRPTRIVRCHAGDKRRGSLKCQGAFAHYFEIIGVEV